MPLLLLADLPRYDCLLAAAERYPSLDPTAIEAFLHLLRTADLVSEARARFLSRHKVAQGRFTVLMLLHRCNDPESITLAELALQAGVTRATMTGLVDTLEKDRLVIRQADAHDRRTINVHLTPLGHSFLEGMLPDWFRCVASIIQPLNEAERKRLVGLLHKLQEGLSAPPSSTF